MTIPAKLLFPPVPLKVEDGGGGGGKYTLSGTCLTPFASGSCDDDDDDDRPPPPSPDPEEGGLVRVGSLDPLVVAGAGVGAGRGTNFDATFQYFSKSSARRGTPLTVSQPASPPIQRTKGVCPLRPKFKTEKACGGQGTLKRTLDDGIPEVVLLLLPEIHHPLGTPPPDIVRLLRTWT